MRYNINAFCLLACATVKSWRNSGFIANDESNLAFVQSVTFIIESLLGEGIWPFRLES